LPLVLAVLSSQPNEIARDPTLPVVAHRVRGVSAQRQNRVLAVPKAQSLEPGIDRPLRLRMGPWISSRARAAEKDPSIGPQEAPIRCQPFHLGLAPAHVGNRARRPLKSLAD